MISTFGVLKKNLNWSVPDPLASLFDEVVAHRFGSEKAKWKGAVAAILMYLEASEEARAAYDDRATQTATPRGLSAEIARAKKARNAHPKYWGERDAGPGTSEDDRGKPGSGPKRRR